MSTAQATHELQEIASLLSAEVRGYEQHARSIDGDIVVSCFKSAVCIDLRMSIIDLPTALWSIYDAADTHRHNVYDPATLAESIEKIGAGKA